MVVIAMRQRQHPRADVRVRNRRDAVRNRAVRDIRRVAGETLQHDVGVGEQHLRHRALRIDADAVAAAKYGFVAQPVRQPEARDELLLAVELPLSEGMPPSPPM